MMALLLGAPTCTPSAGGGTGGSGGGTGGGAGEVETIRFVVLGDGGEGNDAQYQVGHTMAEVCGQLGCDFALYLGDNFYSTGVSSVDDPQFDTKFEMPYADLEIPFYVVLGNHDYGASGLGIEAWKGNYQVEYTSRSRKWHMPNEYYSFTEGPATFFALDTNAIMWGVGTQTQQDWLDAEISGATTPWRIAFGHHPYISNGSHGNAGNYEGLPSLTPIMAGRHVRDLFEESLCDRVDVYFSGHDHNRQWLPEACGIQHFVSGAASKTTGLVGRGNDTDYEDDSEVGFLWVQIRGDELLGRFYDQNGDVDFEQTITRPSSRR
jgi:hypothetical protein